MNLRYSVTTAAFLATLVSTVLALACSGPIIQPAPAPAPVTLGEMSVAQGTDQYREGGFIVGEGGMPFVGTIGFAAGPSSDSSLAVIALSIPPRALSFVRAGDRFAAYYSVRLDVSEGARLVRSDRLSGEVRVANFQETARSDEGIIYQRVIALPSGAYSLRISANDSLGNASGSVTLPITVPAFRGDGLSSLIPVFTSQPRASRAAPLTIVSNPRATLRFGRDTAIGLYLERYGGSPDSVVVTAMRDGRPVRTDTMKFDSPSALRAGQLAIPIARLGFGRIAIGIADLEGVYRGQAIFIVNPGADLPVRTVDELLDATRFFVSEAELRVVRAAAPDTRPALWAALLKRSDPSPATPENEAWAEYARRVRLAAALFGDSITPGWRTERGGIMAAIGEPDVMNQPALSDSVGQRLMTWEYRRYRLTLSFFDASGFGRWQLTPSSDADFKSFLSLAGPCVGCR